ncbi:D-sedoheptulose 7-phosphate isomerase [Halodesulfovibrio sp.]|jgi:D-sedoheptulose 7-phosphate isomerase|uniref:D-sedoheptulose 7-phosphate isomerase n=1 Tax=Halodesulfovibrio sp. TaxID=1912772 RepID=UPI0025EAD2B2|nr:D-sedoheptulose 7-phosphate isomerase [Halodesulfovibrio sp.]MCT4534528.1 D-sedoheptulose 7-phosphate isomerase [Halodesulfovibrio sp.]MCT4626026.1 D-sedoheptulose 7-phosphate isomerase [Halodesulfovibrio sp.]
MTQQAIDTILEHAREGARLREEYFAAHAEDVDAVARKFAVCLAKGGKILFCGNGGSAADAQHLAAEFVNRFLIERPPLPSIALTTDTSILTAIGNDYGYDLVFSKQVQALGNKNDILVGISTSGNSTNIINACNAARERGLVTVGFTGNGGGKMTELCDFLLDVPHTHTPLIQEVQLTIGHLLCQLTDYYLFEDAAALQADLEAAE